MAEIRHEHRDEYVLTMSAQERELIMDALSEYADQNYAGADDLHNTIGTAEWSGTPLSPGDEVMLLRPTEVYGAGSRLVVRSCGWTSFVARALYRSSMTLSVDDEGVTWERVSAP